MADPHADDNPARRFLESQPQADWKIWKYLQANSSKLLTDAGFDNVCDCWVRELTRLRDDPATSVRKRGVASTLLNRYKPGYEDYGAARAFRDVMRTGNTEAMAAVAAKPSVIISGNHNLSTTTTNFSLTASSASTAQSSRKRKSANNETESKSKRPAAAPVFLKHFASCYKNMSPSRKWMLPSGLCVEDTLYECFKDASEECAVHSWVIDTRDSAVRDCLSDADWVAICAEIPPLPDADPKFVKSMIQYASARTPDRLRDYLDTTAPFTPDELSTLSLSERSARCWVYDVLRAWANLCAVPSTFTQNHREFWYVANFWSTVFDTCMASIPGAYMSRGESKSHSTTARKNLDASKRRRVGHLYDGVLSIHEYEVGAAEHARTWLGEVERKWVVDSRKVVKALHDMLYELQTPGVQVIGLITAGWRCQLLRMMYAKGYVCLVGADRIRKVPTPQEGIAPLLEMLSLVWKMKGALTTSHLTAELSREELEERLLNPEIAPSTSASSSKTMLIPRSVETDDDLLAVDEEDDATVVEETPVGEEGKVL